MCPASALSKPHQTKSEQREFTRARMLDAVLEIIVSDGMRAVRHRAVAERAGVALGTTTYHFKSMEDLIVSAFSYWCRRSELMENPYYQKMADLLAPYAESPMPEALRSCVAGQIYELSVDYFNDQLTVRRQDRVIELAFYHESLCYDALRVLVLDTWQSELDHLIIAHRCIGSSRPEDDARITFSLFRTLEQEAVIANLPQLDTTIIRRTLHRHFTLSLGAQFPLGGACVA